MNIPIYRAKSLDNGEYVVGYYFKDEDNPNLHYISDRWCIEEYGIDPSTLAIHFPDMIDKNGKRIFASLSEDGKGGDFEEDFGVVCYRDNSFVLVYAPNCREEAEGEPKWDYISEVVHLEVTGIYKGEENANRNTNN
jgi:hypothetical protein